MHSDFASSPELQQGCCAQVAVSRYLKNVPLFAEIGEEEFDKVSEAILGTEKKYKPGQHIIRQGDIGLDFFLVIDGECHASINAEGDSFEARRAEPVRVKSYGKHSTLFLASSAARSTIDRSCCFAVAGDYFGELALQRADSKRAANVVADTDVTCLSISRGDFRLLTEGVSEVEVFQEPLYNERIAISTWLRNVPMFSEISDEDFGRVSDAIFGREKKYKAGDAIIRQGDDGFGTSAFLLSCTLVHVGSIGRRCR